MLKSVLPGVFCLVFTVANAQNDSLRAKTNYFSTGFSVSHTPIKISRENSFIINNINNYYISNRAFLLSSGITLQYTKRISKFNIGIEYTASLVHDKTNYSQTYLYGNIDSNNLQYNQFYNYKHSKYFNQLINMFFLVNTFENHYKSFSIGAGIALAEYYIYYLATKTTSVSYSYLNPNQLTIKEHYYSGSSSIKNYFLRGNREFYIIPSFICKYSFFKNKFSIINRIQLMPNIFNVRLPYAEFLKSDISFLYNF
jgi:hypothetical protein